MVNRKLEDVLVYDHLNDGKSPQYDVGGNDDAWYLGLAGELASEIKCSQILLPMLDRGAYDWEDKLRAALLEAASICPQRHVDSFAQAWPDLATHDQDGCESYTWFGNEETINKLHLQIQYDENGKYYPFHYAIDRCGLVLDLPPKVIAIATEPQYFGVLCINDNFFNFMFKQNKIQTYYLRNLKIGPDA